VFSEVQVLGSRRRVRRHCGWSITRAACGGRWQIRCVSVRPLRGRPDLTDRLLSCSVRRDTPPSVPPGWSPTATKWAPKNSCGASVQRCAYGCRIPPGRDMTDTPGICQPTPRAGCHRDVFLSSPYSDHAIDQVSHVSLTERGRRASLPAQSASMNNAWCWQPRSRWRYVYRAVDQRRLHRVPDQPVAGGAVPAARTHVGRQERCRRRAHPDRHGAHEAAHAEADRW
jgi:hypothetical protein